jgi:integrase
MGPRLRLRNLNHYIDRHGRPRYYHRPPGGKNTPLLGLPFSQDWMTAYHAAERGAAAPAATKMPLAKGRNVEGTVEWLVALFLASETFKAWHESTKYTRRNIYERFREEDGKKRIFVVERDGRRVMLLDRHHVQVMIESRAAKKWAQRNFVTALRSLFEWAESVGKIPENPMVGIKRIKLPKTVGFPVWSEEDIAKFEARWAVGTKERKAFALLLYTGQRRIDVKSLGRQHMAKRADKWGWWLVFEPQKTKGSKTEPMEIPMHPKLLEAIAACPSDNLTFVTTATGRPYHENSFSRFITEAAKLAGVAERSPHGLRKACATRLAEIGCPEKWIAAITGHASLNEIVRYTRSANRRRMASAAMSAMQAFEAAGAPEDADVPLALPAPADVPGARQVGNKS